MPRDINVQDSDYVWMVGSERHEGTAVARVDVRGIDVFTEAPGTRIFTDKDDAHEYADWKEKHGGEGDDS